MTRARRRGTRIRRYDVDHVNEAVVRQAILHHRLLCVRDHTRPTPCTVGRIAPRRADHHCRHPGAHLRRTRHSTTDCGRYWPGEQYLVCRQIRIEYRFPRPRPELPRHRFTDGDEVENVMLVSTVLPLLPNFPRAGTETVRRSRRSRPQRKATLACQARAQEDGRPTTSNGDHHSPGKSLSTPTCIRQSHSSDSIPEGPERGEMQFHRNSRRGHELGNRDISG